MNNRFCSYLKNVFLPCLAFSVTAGFISAILITVFKWAAKEIMDLSAVLYGWGRVHPIAIGLFVLGAAAVGLLASFLLSRSRSCRGGGIPTAVAAVRGIVDFNWIAGVFVLPFSALLTFLCGLPLGTEGPCVQMGTAIGDGVVKCLGRKTDQGWRRYVMTGGASAGFSIATSSPVAAVLFSIEELHRRFSPMLLTVTALSVITAQITVRLLAFWGLGTVTLFDLPVLDTVSPKQFFVPILVGLICGGCSILFTRFYHLVGRKVHAVLKKVPEKVMFPLLFTCVSAVGIFMPNVLGTGHALVEEFSRTQTMWYLLAAVFLIRAIAMMISNTAGVTGGIFLPTLAFGAIIGSLCGEGMIALGWIGTDVYPLVVVLGITAFLGSTSHIPLTAGAFAVETLGGIRNIPSVILAVMIAFLVVKVSGTKDFTDAVVEAKLRSIRKGKKTTTHTVSLIVKPNAFVIGKELRDILWPGCCTVVSFERARNDNTKGRIDEGDILTICYTTSDPTRTAEELAALVGNQTDVQ